MTYLELVNKVLVRMREPEVTGLVSTDPVVLLAKEYVRKARNDIERAHQWAALRAAIPLTATATLDAAVLPGAHPKSFITEVFREDGTRLKETTWADIVQSRLYSESDNEPTYYATSVSGNDLQIELYPTPAVTETLTVVGYIRTADLTNDTDPCYIPCDPIIDLAYAMCIRERGETGGISSQEAFQIAKMSLQDEIALDAAMHDEEAVWKVG